MLLHPGGPPRHRGRLLPAGRGRRPQPEHQGVQPGPLLVAAFKGIPKRSSQRDSWKHEVLIDDYKKHIKDHFNRKKAEVKKIIYQPITNNYLLPIAFLLFIEHQPVDRD